MDSDSDVSISTVSTPSLSSDSEDSQGSQNFAENAVPEVRKSAKMTANEPLFARFFCNFGVKM
jgi:hypothetical protein